MTPNSKRDWVDIMNVYRASKEDLFYTSKECDIPIHILEYYVKQYGVNWDGEIPVKYVAQRGRDRDMPPCGPVEPERTFSTATKWFDVDEFTGRGKKGWII